MRSIVLCLVLGALVCPMAAGQSEADPILETNQEYSLLTDGIIKVWAGFALLRDYSSLAYAPIPRQYLDQNAAYAISVLEGHGGANADTAVLFCVPEGAEVIGVGPEPWGTLMQFAKQHGFVGNGAGWADCTVVRGGLVGAARELSELVEHCVALTRTHAEALIAYYRSCYGYIDEEVVEGKCAQLVALARDLAGLADAAYDAALRALQASGEDTRRQCWLEVESFAVMAAGRTDANIAGFGAVLPTSLANDALLEAEDLRDDLLSAVTREIYGDEG